MTSIFIRENGDGSKVWRAVIRRKGYRTVCNHFATKREAITWAKEAERIIKKQRDKDLLNEAACIFRRET